RSGHARSVVPRSVALDNAGRIFGAAAILRPADGIEWGWPPCGRAALRERFRLRDIRVRAQVFAFGAARGQARVVEHLARRGIALAIGQAQKDRLRQLRILAANARAVETLAPVELGEGLRRRSRLFVGERQARQRALVVA